MYEEYKKCTGTVTTAKNEVFYLGYNMKINIWWGDKPLVGGIKIGEIFLAGGGK